MFQISKEQIEELFVYKEFIPFLKEFLKKEVEVPDRNHFTIPTLGVSDGNLLTMPSWMTNEFMGVKIVSVFPDNVNIPSINGSYLLMSAKTGEQLAWIDGLALTVKRTAAMSGLASQFLSRNDSNSLMMIGTGNLSGELIKAHHCVRPLKQVWIWGRSYLKAQEKAKQIKLTNCQIDAVKELNPVIDKADIISTATLSSHPLVLGKYLKKEVYLDLVGSFKKNSREADNACLQNANIFVDNYHALNESGDLYIPLQSGFIQKSDIISDLVSLCRATSELSLSYPKTFFKSVGFAAPDLAAAVYLYQKNNA